MRSGRDARPVVLWVVVLAGGAGGACSSEPSRADSDGVGGGTSLTVCGDERLTYESFGGPFFLDWCTGCHSARLGKGERQGAPEGVDFDTLDGILQHQDRIVARAVEQSTMPPVGGPSDADRERLGQWLACGAPVELATFAPSSPPSSLMERPALGECAEAPETLPEEVLPRCTSETGACVLACNETEPDDPAREACREACLAADPTPGLLHDGLPVDCSNCAFLQIMGCGAQAGCAPEVADVNCCIDTCVSSGDPNCFETECDGALQGFIYCIAFQAPSCADYGSAPIADCFAAE